MKALSEEIYDKSTQGT